MLHMLLSDAIIRNLHILQDSRGIGEVLTGLLIYYLDENFTEASLKTRRRDLEVES